MVGELSQDVHTNRVNNYHKSPDSAHSILYQTKQIFCFDLTLYSLPNDKILDVTKLKAHADDNLNVAKMMISLSDGVENTVGKGENAGY